jgi:phospholipid:diacylglycerol acyltransferase
MKDTVQMNPAGTYVMERFLSREERQKLFRSWAGSAGMWIKGGESVWGSTNGAPDDGHDCSHTHGDLISFRVPPPVPENNNTGKGLGSDSGVEEDPRNMTADAAGAWILTHTPSSFQVRRTPVGQSHTAD